MIDIATWGPAVVAVAALLAICKFWMSMGASAQTAKDAKTIASTASAKCDLVTAALNEFKANSAREFATIGDLSNAETRLAAAVEGIRTDFRNVAERFDKILIELARAKPQ